jgi:hypothetical protein
MTLGRIQARFSGLPAVCHTCRERPPVAFLSYIIHHKGLDEHTDAGLCTPCLHAERDDLKAERVSEIRIKWITTKVLPKRGRPSFFRMLSKCGDER